MSSNIKAIAERFYEVVNAGDDLGLVFADDIQFSIMRGFPYGGDYDGLAATKAFFENLGKHFEFWEVHPDRFIEVDDNNIVVTGRYVTRSSETGKDVEMETVHIWSEAGGKMISYKHYCDTALLSAAMNHNVPMRP